MTLFLFANNASTTLASSVAPTDTVIQVASGTGSLFPNPGAGQQFAVTFQDAATGLIEEIAYCTSISGDNLTVVRGREGTVAKSWTVGDDLSNYWTAGSAAAFVQLPSLQSQTTNFATDSGSDNALSIALTPAIAAYSNILGSAIRIFKNSAPNSGNVTLTINGLGPLPVLLPGGSQVPANFLSGSSIIEVVYDGTSFEVISIGSFSVPGGNAGGDLAGTYPNPVVAANKISNGKLAVMPPFTVKMNNTGGSVNPQDVVFNTLISALGFSGNLSATGHAVISLGAAGDLIINWGPIPSTSTGQNTSVTFDEAFPNAVFGVWADTQGGASSGSGSNDCMFQSYNLSQSGASFNLKNFTTFSSGPQSGFYIAIGN